jgi:hypothetical protein
MGGTLRGTPAADLCLNGIDPAEDADDLGGKGRSGDRV